MNSLPKLYKKSVTGQILQWWIEVEGSKYRSHYGLVDGIVTTTEWTISKPKNLGKNNETSAEEQAFKDALSKWNKKKDREKFNEIVQDDEVGYISPMLALNYKDRKNEINFNDGVWIQCKLNGARAIASKNGIFSRKGKEWLSVPHLNNILRSFFEKHPDVILDGELFNSELRNDLGAIISMISKKKIIPDDLIKSEKYIHYYIYDVVDPTKKYEERLEMIKEFVREMNNHHIILVDSFKSSSYEEIDEFLKKFENDGHEGAIVRTNGVYEQKRSKNLLKYKSFFESEFLIVDVVEGEGNLRGKVGAFILKDERGVNFDASPIGSHEYWEKMWNEKVDLIGKHATVKYKELTPVKNGRGGVPSFGKVVSIRDYEN